MRTSKWLDYKDLKEPAVTPELARQHGLLDEEYQNILRILGRTPTFTELGIFSVMWSEHCSYKNSIALLKTLPKTGKNVLKGAGEENAGLINIGDGLAVAFKIESHNHPSAVEPYQGAATGVGGILRDIFTMGARPVASLNSLRFGDLSDPKVRHLFANVVKGIGDYGNCFGVPTVSGEIYFDDSYTENPLVNAMAVGIVDHKHTASAVAKGPGNPVMIVGSSTGRDGIHGATFASVEISEESESKRSNVQVGDPFTEKLLLEATLEAVQSGYLVGIQDMGAAGLTCSGAEMSAKGLSGMEIELTKVPVREDYMTPYEIMLSESQERMLLVVQKGREEAVQKIFEKWDLHGVIIGHVTNDKSLRVKYQDAIVAEIPADTLVLGGGAPVYYRETKQPAYIEELNKLDNDAILPPKDLNETLNTLLASPNIASREWVYEQYDTSVRTNTVTLPGSDSAVIRIKGTDKALAMKVDCNGRYVYLNPKRGTMIAVAESARNVVASGARPAAITNCLNFGNPYKPEMYWQFKQAVEGMKEACLALGTPVTGGNVSFYNESPQRAVYPTPAIGMIGIIDHVRVVTTSWFKNEDDLIFLIGKNKPEIGGSEYLKVIHGLVRGAIPELNLNYEKAVQSMVLEAIQHGSAKSAHDVSDGGLAVAFAECCFQGNRGKTIGAEIQLRDAMRPDLLLFGESQSRFIVTVPDCRAELILSLAKKHNIDAVKVGVVGGSNLRINGWINLRVKEMENVYRTALSQYMKQ